MRCRLPVDPDREYGGLLLLKHKDGWSTTSSVDGFNPTLLEKGMGKVVVSTVRGHVCFGAFQLGEAVKRDATATAAGEPAKRLYCAVYADMQSVTSAVMLLTDLEAYIAHSKDCDPVLKSLVLVFPSAEPTSQEAFEGDYWRFMQHVSDLSVLTHPWPADASQDPASDDFRLWLAGERIFTTTLHAHSPRLARKVIIPTWVINLESQFDALRDRGQLDAWRKGIRKGDAARDPSGVANPAMALRDVSSAALQLAGSAINPCPFRVRYSALDVLGVGQALLAAAHSENAPEPVLEVIRTRLRAARQRFD